MPSLESQRNGRAGESPNSTPHSPLRALLHLLETGLLPWWADNLPAPSLVLQAWLRNDPEGMAKALRTCSHLPQAISRLQRMAPQTQLHTWWLAVAAHGLDALPWEPHPALRQWLQTLASRPSTTITAIWQATLLTMAVKPSSTPLAQAIASCIQSLAPAHPGNAGLRSALEAAPVPPPVRRQVEQLLQSPLASASRIDLPAESLTAPHAGLILIAPWLPALFSTLGLTDNDSFISPEAQAQAVLLTSHLATGSTESPEEHHLLLPKLLCGLQPTDALPPAPPLKPLHHAEADALLNALLQHWPALSASAPEELRHLFLQRPGTLARIPGAWRLALDRNGFDVLLDQVTWPYATLRLPWMQEMIFTEW